MSEATQPWVLESGECSMGDHEIVEIFIGTEDEAVARAAELNRSRSALDAVDVFAYPVTRATPADVVITGEPVLRKGDAVDVHFVGGDPMQGRVTALGNLNGPLVVDVAYG
jgi:hypothetical protein